MRKETYKVGNFLATSAVAAGILFSSTGCRVLHEERRDTFERRTDKAGLIAPYNSLGEKVSNLLDHDITEEFPRMPRKEGKLPIYEINPIHKTIGTNDIFIYAARYVPQETLKETLKNVLTHAHIDHTLSTIPEQNRIIITVPRKDPAQTPAKNLEEMADLIKTLDVEFPLVGVNVQIYRVFADYTYDVSSIIKGAQKNEKYFTPTLDVNLKGAELRTPGRAGLGSEFGIAGVVAGYALEASLNQLVSKGFAESLANPYIVVPNGSTNNLVSRTVKVPVRETVVVGAALHEITRFENVENMLRVSAQVRDEGYIRLSVEAQTGETSPSGPLQTPIINTRKTIIDGVQLKNGQTYVASGFLSSNKQSVERRSPVIEKIPILRRFFRGKDDESSKDMVIFMFTPTILDNAAYIEQEENERIMRLRGNGVKDKDKNDSPQDKQLREALEKTIKGR